MTRSYFPASLVMFHGNVNIGGRNGNNLEASRDGCEIYWHAQTGGVVVAWGDAQHYVPAVSVMSVSFGAPVAADGANKGPQAAHAPSPAKDAPPAVADASVADRVLEEFSEAQDATPKPTPKRQPRGRG